MTALKWKTAQLKAIEYAVDKKLPRLLIIGGAGTGKTAVLKEIISRLQYMGKDVIAAAPTGVAALNIKSDAFGSASVGMTIHSLFAIKAKTIEPYPKLLKSSKEANDVFRYANTLIVDEISMIRTDIMEAMMLRIRKSGNRSLQIIFAGDMLQLAPILEQEEVAKYAASGFDPNNIYFASSKLLARENFMCVRLTELVRLQDKEHPRQETLRILNNLRQHKDIEQTVKTINAHCSRSGVPETTLTATNQRARDINKAELEKLKGDTVTFTATVIPGTRTLYIDDSNDDGRSPFISPVKLELRPGAKVMITRNIYSNVGPRERKLLYANGTMAKIIECVNNERTGEKRISIQITSGPRKGDRHMLTREKWEKTRYRLDRKTNRIEEEIEYSFIQYPLVHAWAITVHKSQGLTLQNYAIDLENKTFARNMAYVALSRAQTLSDVILRSDLTEEEFEPIPYLYELNKELKTDKVVNFGRLNQKIMPSLAQFYLRKRE